MSAPASQRSPSPKDLAALLEQSKNKRGRKRKLPQNTLKHCVTLRPRMN
jgi:hypothetical protein